MTAADALKKVYLELMPIREARDLYGVSTAMSIVSRVYTEETGAPLVSWRCVKCDADAGYKDKLDCYCTKHWEEHLGLFSRNATQRERNRSEEVLRPVPA